MAGGKGTRFRSSLPKQFLELEGKPVILHTLEAFYRYADSIHVVLVLPEEDIPTWNDLSKKYHFKKPLTVQSGGATRFQSVRKGLQKIGDDGLVAIHDGVRPLVSTEIIAASFRLAKLYRAAVAAIGLRDSIRMIDPSPPDHRVPFDKSKALDRSHYRLIQTPQTFETGLIKGAYSLPEDPSLTDDASVAENAGHSICLFEGSYENIKITTAEDLVIARALMNYRKGV